MILEGWIEDDLQGLDGTPLPNIRLSTLERILSDIDSDMTISSVKRMRSRKNVVLELEVVSCEVMPRKYVAKLFVAESYDKELEILRNCLQRGLRVPHVVRAESGVCLMEYLEGELLVDRLNRTFEESLSGDIALWYYEFHRSQNIVKGDPRLRNFICTPNGLFGVDFEEAGPGKWMADIAGISASILDTDPIFDPRKRILVWSVLDKYLALIGETKTKEIVALYIRTIADTLEQTSRWRDDPGIMDLSKRIRDTGIPSD